MLALAVALAAAAASAVRLRVPSPPLLRGTAAGGGRGPSAFAAAALPFGAAVGAFITPFGGATTPFLAFPFVVEVVEVGGAVPPELELEVVDAGGTDCFGFTSTSTSCGSISLYR